MIKCMIQEQIIKEYWDIVLFRQGDVNSDKKCEVKKKERKLTRWTLNQDEEIFDNISVNKAALVFVKLEHNYERIIRDFNKERARERDAKRDQGLSKNIDSMMQYKTQFKSTKLMVWKEEKSQDWTECV